MEVRKDEFPVVVQAYETHNQQEVFVAEQVVNSQVEIDSFTSKFAGKLIKARSLSETEYRNRAVAEENTYKPKKKSSSGTIWIVLLLLIVILVAVGFATGWIQQTFNINI